MKVLTARAVALLREMWPNPHVSASYEILPEIREFERTSTTVKRLLASLDGSTRLLVEPLLMNPIRGSTAGVARESTTARAWRDTRGASRQPERKINEWPSGTKSGRLPYRYS